MLAPFLPPFVATSSDPWDRAKAAHLARRAGFGARPEQVDQLVALGCEHAVDSCVDFAFEDPELETRMRECGGPLQDIDDPERPGQPRIENVRLWWLFRMVHARAPLAEKLALFWHGHFATQEAEDLRATLVLAQNQMFRRLGPGAFGELLSAVARDAAMIYFLDNRSNAKGHPNENWARELLELFTLGLDCYTQRDVVEIARAFTGWSSPELASTEFEFVPAHHDEGDKLVFGQPLRGRGGPDGVNEGEEVLERIRARPEWAPRIGAKLVAWFVSDEPRPELARALGEHLQAGGTVREALRTLFRSQAFYAPDVRRALFKNPVEFVVSALRALRVQNPHLIAIDTAVRDMGMQLFRPPSVAGWNTGVSWIHAGALLARADFARVLGALPHSALEVNGSAAIDFDSLGNGVQLGGEVSGGGAGQHGGDAQSGAALVRVLATRLDLLELSEERIEALGREVEAAGPARRARTRAAVSALIAAPEFALA